MKNYLLSVLFVLIFSNIGLSQSTWSYDHLNEFKLGESYNTYDKFCRDNQNAQISYGNKIECTFSVLNFSLFGRNVRQVTLNFCPTQGLELPERALCEIEALLYADSIEDHLTAFDYMKEEFPSIFRMDKEKKKKPFTHITYSEKYKYTFNYALLFWKDELNSYTYMPSSSDKITSYLKLEFLPNK